MVEYSETSSGVHAHPAAPFDPGGREGIGGSPASISSRGAPVVLTGGQRPPSPSPTVPLEAGFETSSACCPAKGHFGRISGIRTQAPVFRGAGRGPEMAGSLLHREKGWCAMEKVSSPRHLRRHPHREGRKTTLASDSGQVLLELLKLAGVFLVVLSILHWLVTEGRRLLQKPYSDSARREWSWGARAQPW